MIKLIKKLHITHNEYVIKMLHNQSECNCIYQKYLVHTEAHIRHYMHLSLIGGIVAAYMHACCWRSDHF